MERSLPVWTTGPQLHTSISRYTFSGITDYQVSQEVPLFGSHIIKPHSSIHEAAHNVTRRKREGPVLGQGWRRHRFTGGTRVLTFTGRTGALSCRESGKKIPVD